MTRQRVLEELRAAGPLHPLDLAVRLELHVNTVHRHLEVLEGAGLVSHRPEPRRQPGRPRVVYESTDMSGTEHAGHRFLARLLASYVSANLDPEQVGEEAGKAWGQHLIGVTPFARTDADVAVDRALELLDELGFAPSQHHDDDALELGRCPYPDLAEELPQLICALHVGLVRGALTGLGAPLEIIDLEARPGQETPCVLRYRRTDRPAPSSPPTH